MKVFWFVYWWLALRLVVVLLKLWLNRLRLLDTLFESDIGTLVKQIDKAFLLYWHIIIVALYLVVQWNIVNWGQDLVQPSARVDERSRIRSIDIDQVIPIDHLAVLWGYWSFPLVFIRTIPLLKVVSMRFIHNVTPMSRSLNKVLLGVAIWNSVQVAHWLCLAT